MYQILTSIHERALTVYYLCSVTSGTLLPDRGLLGPVWLCSSEPLFVRAPASCTASGSTAMALSTSYLPNCHINTHHLLLFTKNKYFFFLPSFPEKLAPRQPFTDSKTLLKLFNIVHYFCDFVLSCFFCTDNDDLKKKKQKQKTKLKKGGRLVETKGHQMLLYCCHHTIILLVSSAQWPVFWKWGAESISGYFTFKWCLSMCIYVYISIRISTRVHVSILQERPSCSSSLFYFFLTCGSWFWL